MGAGKGWTGRLNRNLSLRGVPVKSVRPRGGSSLGVLSRRRSFASSAITIYRKADEHMMAIKPKARRTIRARIAALWILLGKSARSEVWVRRGNR